MFRKTALILVVAIFLIPFSPSTGMGRYYRSPRSHYSHHSHHYRHYRHHHHGYYGDEALLWVAGGLLLGTIVVAATLPPPPPRQVVYVSPPPQIFAYPPEVPAGMCRWERYILDEYGRVVLDRYGQPIKQYTLGSCQYPPN